MKMTLTQQEMQQAIKEFIERRGQKIKGRITLKCYTYNEPANKFSAEVEVIVPPAPKDIK